MATKEIPVAKYDYTMNGRIWRMIKCTEIMLIKTRSTRTTEAQKNNGDMKEKAKHNLKE